MNKKVTSIVAYISIVGWLIAFIAGDKKGAKLHLNQGLVLGVLWVIASVINWILGGIPLIGGIIGFICAIINLFVFVLSVVGIIYAATDKDAELPIIGAIKLLN